MSQDNENSRIQERIHKIELKESRHEVRFIKMDRKMIQLNSELKKNSEKLDRLIRRMTIIGAFVSGVLFVSSDSGGNILRTLIGAFL